MKKKYNTCHALEFAKQLCADGKVEWMQNLKKCEDTVLASLPALQKADSHFQGEGEAKHTAHVAYTVCQWMKSMQCYSISKELADDLFSMDDLSFPVDKLHLPFPVIFLDMENLNKPFVGMPGCKLLGCYIMVDEVPYTEMTVTSFCSIVVLGLDQNGEYFFGGTAFDYYPEHMEDTLEGTIEKLTEALPEQREYLKEALLFAAYLSSEQPEVVENEEQKKIYHPSNKPKYSSMRKWDVGVRYMREVQRRKENVEETEPSELSGSSNSSKRNSPRPHMRRAHWQTYRVGPGRKEKRILWIPPITVGMKCVEETLPVTIRQKTKEKKE